MRSIAFGIAAVALSGVTAVPAVAGDSNGRFHVLGAGTVRCSAYTAATAEQKVYAETWWAGYVTAMNRSTADTYNIVGNVSVEQVNGAIATFCQANPEALLAIAVHKVLEDAYPNRVQRAPN